MEQAEEPDPSDRPKGGREWTTIANQWGVGLLFAMLTSHCRA